MPWIPELFSTRFLADLRQRLRQERINAVPYFDGILAGEVDALVDSFAGEPELHHPVRGRVKGREAFTCFILDTSAWLQRSNCSVEPVDLVVTEERTVEEIVLSYDSDERDLGGAPRRVMLPIAIVTDRVPDGLVELRLYFSTWPITGGHAIRPPLLQPVADLHAGDVVGEYQRALAAGDAVAATAAFEHDGYAREPAGGAYVHRGTAELRDLYDLFFSNGGGIPLEHCTITDDGRACALEYNVVQWGRTPLPPEAGVAVYVRGASGKLAAARIYDDSDPPLHP